MLNGLTDIWYKHQMVHLITTASIFISSSFLTHSDNTHTYTGCSFLAYTLFASQMAAFLEDIVGIQRSRTLAFIKTSVNYHVNEILDRQRLEQERARKTHALLGEGILPE